MKPNRTYRRRGTAPPGDSISARVDLDLKEQVYALARLERKTVSNLIGGMLRERVNRTLGASVSGG